VIYKPRKYKFIKAHSTFAASLVLKQVNKRGKERQQWQSWLVHLS
jgi:hypothetical protein